VGTVLHGSQSPREFWLYRTPFFSQKRGRKKERHYIYDPRGKVGERKEREEKKGKTASGKKKRQDFIARGESNTI